LISGAGIANYPGGVDWWIAQKNEHPEQYVESGWVSFQPVASSCGIHPTL
jgi:hypothetical protein